MEDEFSQLLKIPKERVAVLIGTKGETKHAIEKDTGTKIRISADGDVTITGPSYDAWITRQIVKAIGRGFSPKTAMLLLDEDFAFELIEIEDWAKNENAEKRLRGRVIGQDGQSRDTIEELTCCHISVFGKTIGIIGEITNIQTARKAIEMLLSGAKHATVYRLLEEERKKQRRIELLGGEA
jgi:ribosomal RNA assembly protein